MTIDELVELDSKGWEKLTDADLLLIFKDALTVTRPELAKTRTTNQQKQLPIINMNPAKQAALKELQLAGLDIGFMMRKKKK